MDPNLPEYAVEKIVAAMSITDCTPEEAEAARDRIRTTLLEKLNSPEAMEGRRRNAEKVAADEAAWKASEDAREAMRQDWIENRAFFWLALPHVPFPTGESIEDENGDWMPEYADGPWMPDAPLAEFRAHWATWERTKPRGKLNQWMFDRWFLDWETILDMDKGLMHAWVALGMAKPGSSSEIILPPGHLMESHWKDRIFRVVSANERPASGKDDVWQGKFWWDRPTETALEDWPCVPCGWDDMASIMVR